GQLALADRWILSRLDATIEDADRLMQAHQYGEAGKTIREFVWSELCDWYIEAAKVRQRGSAAERQVVAQTLAYAMDEAAETEFGALIETVRAIRNARTEAGVEPGRWIAAEVFAGTHAGAFETARRELGTLARIAADELVIRDGAPQASQGALTAVAGNVVAMQRRRLATAEEQISLLQRRLAELDA
ncbi:MAG: valS, partial [Thermomicrobiales bacterium]|nr:valS [Thermomicrobiales bacterium]